MGGLKTMRRQDETKLSAAPATPGAPGVPGALGAPSTPGAEAASKPDATAEPKKQAGPRDGFVLLSIAVVACAVSTMLYAQFGLPLGMAIGAGVGAWMLFMLIHKQVQKSAQINELKAELARARFQSAKPQRPTALRGMKLSPATGAGGEQRQPDFPSATTASEAAKSAAAAVARSAPLGAAGPAVAPQRPAANSDVASAPIHGRMSVPPLRGTMPAAEQAAGEISSNDTSIDLTGMRLPPSGSATPSLGIDAAREERPAGGVEMIRDQWSFRPRSEAPAQGAPAVARGATTVEGDLELVQRKIRELADEVNFVEAARPSAKPLRPDMRSTPTTDAIEHSIGALKAAATTMRERPGGLGDFIPKSAMPEPASTPSHKTSSPQPASLPDLGELVIPATAERIAGADHGPKKPEPEAASRHGPHHHELPLPERPLIDFGMNSAPPPAAPQTHGRELAQAIESAAADVFLAPIVTLSEHAVNHYEMTVAPRSPDGTRLDAREEEFALVGPDLAAKFDSERLQRAAALSLRMEARDKDGSLLVEIMGSSLSERAFLETIAQVYGARPKVATQLVVLLTQRAIDAFTPSVWQAIRDMHAYGFRFALDGIEHMRTDFAALAVAGFGFIRLPSHVVFDGFTASDRFVAADEIYQRATLAGLSIVATGIADAKTQKRLLEIGVDLGQGALFGVPRQVMLTGPSNQSAAA